MNSLEALIVLLILVGLTIHNYLDSFWELGKLPYAASFSFLVNLFVLVYASCLIWMFGFGFGLLLTLLCWFNFPYNSVLWIFLVPHVLKVQSNPEDFKPNSFIHWCHSKIVIAVGALTIINMLDTSYGHVAKHLRNYSEPVIALLLIIVVGNIVRMIVASVVVKRTP